MQRLEKISLSLIFGLLALAGVALGCGGGGGSDDDEGNVVITVPPVLVVTPPVGVTTPEIVEPGDGGSSSET